MTIRAFIAIELPPEIHRRLADVQHRFKPLFSQSRVTWVKPENIHLTLKFFGDIQPSMVETIEKACQNLQTHSVFSLSLQSLGYFPNAKNPKVFWCGYDASDELNRLHLQLENDLLSLGFTKEEREFSPHLTLARFKELHSHDREALASAVEFDLAAMTHTVDALTLFQSRLTPNGSIYSPLKKFPLKQN
ncbi:RNA 2',3'-cyclic phosphodiesterase [bacterium]|nr:RNA 2',3'-cyclic phosphodiesterase [bacterium]